MKLVVVLLIGFVVAGCGGSETESGEPETVFDPMVETLDQAEAVQDLDLQRKRRMDEHAQPTGNAKPRRPPESNEIGVGAVACWLA